MAANEGSKQGAASELMGALALRLAQTLARDAQRLIDQPPPEDGAAVEKAAKQIKAVADAGRIIVALEQAVDKALAAPAGAPASFPQPDEMDMDDDDLSALDASAPDSDVERRDREDLVARIGRLAGPLECKGLGRRPRSLRARACAAAAAVRAAGGADPA